MFTEAHTHKNTVLQFSGGKDSLCVLHYLRPHWDQLTVLWANSGAAFPETEALMAEIKALVPHFAEVNSDQKSWVAAYGFPVDTIPVRNSGFGHDMEQGDRIKLQPYVTCCGKNVWQPLAEYCSVANGVTTVIRGQRIQEKLKSPLRNGYVEAGVTHLMPIEDWSTEQVFDFLRAHDVKIPAYYSVTDSSLDCWSCTAYLSEVGRFKWLRTHYAERYALVRDRIHSIQAALTHSLTEVNAVLEV